MTHPGDGRGHLGVDLVGRDLEQRLVGVDVLADLLEPAGDRAFRDRLPQLGHRHVHCVLLGSGGSGRSVSAAVRPVSASAASPNTSLSVGCGCTSAAMSAAFASQLTAR